MAISHTQLQQLYLAYFGRPADIDGLGFYASNPNLDIWSVAAAFSASPESQALYGAGFSDETINAIYQNLFNRDAEPAGLLYWSTEVTSGRLTAAGAAYAIFLGAQNEDKVAVQNKMAISAAFTTALDTDLEITGYTGDAAAAAARTFLHTVTSDPASVAAAIAGLDAAVAAVVAEGGVKGQSFTLTTGADTIVGTVNNDTINAVMLNTAGSGVTTLGAFDKIDGGAGIDKLNIYSDGTLNGTLPSSASVKNVEIINIFNEGGTFDTDGFGSIDASMFVGATNVNQVGDYAHVYELASSTTATFTDIDSLWSVGVVAAMDATSASVALSNVGATSAWVGTWGDKLTTVKVTGFLADHAEPMWLDVSAGYDVTSVKITTTVDSDLWVDQFGYSETDGVDSTKAVTRIDASGSTGDIELDAYDTVQTIATGWGDDTVWLNSLTAEDVISTAADETISAVLQAGAGKDTITIATTGTGATTVDAGDGDDEVLVTALGDGKLTVGLGAGNDSFASSEYILATDVIDAGDGVDMLLLSPVDSLNSGAFRNFDAFDVKGMAANLDLDILTASNPVTEIVGSGALGAAAVTLLNLGAGVSFRATGDMGPTNALTLTQKAAGALAVTLDADETGTADTTIDDVSTKIVASNATSVMAAFDTSYLARITGETTAGDNVSTINLSTAAATSVSVVSGGANAHNVLVLADTAATTGKVASVTITGAQALDFAFTSTGANSLASVNASAHAGGLITTTGVLKNSGSITLGSGADVITVASSSTDVAMESLVGFEKTAAVSLSTAPADALAAATAIADADVLFLTGATVATANAVAGGEVTDGVLTFTGVGPATLADAFLIANAAAETAAEAVLFQYLNDSYVFVQMGATDTVVKLTGVTGVTDLVETGADYFFVVSGS